MKKTYMLLAFVFFLASPGSSYAFTIFDFDITFDGVNATIGATSDPIAGTSLVPGDSYSLDISAEGKGFWEVNTTQAGGLFATFVVLDGALRISDITTTLFLDGVQLVTQFQGSVSQSSVHMGGQGFNFIIGTVFDQLVIDLDFLSTTSSPTTIQDRPFIVGFQPFFNASYVDYTVPEPTTLTLFAFGLAGLGFMTRRRRNRRRQA